MKRWIVSVPIVLLLLASAASAQAPLTLKSMGSFYVGGREVRVTDAPIKGQRGRGAGSLHQVEQMYVQYFIPQDQRGALPLLLWHGGALTGAVYETTPDGRPGWLNYFVGKGWAVYNADAMSGGRAGWAAYPQVFRSAPIFLPKEHAFERYRIGTGPGSYHKDPDRMKLKPGSQFPAEAYDEFAKQGVPYWTTNDEATIRAYTELVDKVCPCVVLVHSQSGLFGQVIAQARPDKIKALVLVEPVGTGNPKLAANLKDTPILALYGDYIDEDPRWPRLLAHNLWFLELVREAGGRYDLIELPQIGIKGNSHMMMVEKNSDQIAGVIQDWLVRQGLTRP